MRCCVAGELLSQPRPEGLTEIICPKNGSERVNVALVYPPTPTVVSPCPKWSEGWSLEPAHLTVSPEPPPPLPSHCILCASLISLLHAAPTPLASTNPKAEDSTAHWMTSTLCTSSIEIAFYCIVSLLLHACNVLHSTIVRITFLFVFVILVSATRGCSAPRPNVLNGTNGTKAHKLCASMTFLPCLVSRVHGEIQMKKTWMLLVWFRTWG